MTLSQIQEYVIGVLRGWLPNKSVLDKFTETDDGRLLYNGIEICKTNSVTNESTNQNG
mgnify:FL=1